MFERFSDSSRRVLVLAQDEARDLTSSFIGTEHLLLGLVREREGIAAKVLDTLGVTYEEVREKVELPFDTKKNPSSGSPPFTPRVKKVLEFSLREALQLGHSYIGTEHLLLALVREGNGVAAMILDDLVGDLTHVRTQVLEMITGESGDEMVALEPLTELESDLGRLTSLVRRLGLSLRPDLDFTTRTAYTEKFANELLDELRQRWLDVAIPPSSTPEN
jgi:ATP-dependent Clp protease ATP-binding subunit ClpC